MQKHFLLLLSLFFYTEQSFAWLVTTMKELNLENGQFSGYFTYSELNNYSPPQEVAATHSEWKAGLAIQYGGPHAYFLWLEEPLALKQGATWAEVHDMLVKHYGSSGTKVFSFRNSGTSIGRDLSDICFVVGAGASVITDLYGSFGLGSKTPLTTSLADCKKQANIIQRDWCAMATPSLSFNFGTLKTEDASGSYLEQDVQVYCSYSGVNYSMTLKDKITLSNGMTAELSTISQSNNQGNNINKVRMTLSGTPRTAGDFSGTGILMVSMP